MNIVVSVNNFGDTRSGGLAGPMGLFIIVLMIVATVLLIRNMNKRIKRLPDAFGDAEAARRDAEIARLDADLELPAAEPVRPGGDGGDRAKAPDPAPGQQPPAADGPS
ncbi:hypothetical protein [Krasilnikovia sp. M28-CT-15]|uniref:hypothetical protein n=1 Tax=Krasilnikovia sp. M28-CT-15 TaxID=3373540 RepID=UPI003875CED5